MQTFRSRNIKEEMEKATGALRGQTLSLDDLLKAEVSIIRYCQKQRFQKEIAALSAKRSMARDSVIYKLDPQLDNGLLRVGGRLNREAMPEEMKHLIAYFVLRSVHLHTHSEAHA